jgi:hypothetical protein
MCPGGGGVLCDNDRTAKTTAIAKTVAQRVQGLACVFGACIGSAGHSTVALVNLDLHVLSSTMNRTPSAVSCARLAALYV